MISRQALKTRSCSVVIWSHTVLPTHLEAASSTCLQIHWAMTSALTAQIHDLGMLVSMSCF
eukprot:50697-Eustigmatos_ZCMA.PRE.1